jgi:general secretion pathway protein N
MASPRAVGALRFYHIVLGVILFAGFFLTALPAWLIPWALKKSQFNQIVINDASGSIWSGKATGVADIAVPNSTAYKLKLDQISWSWRPSRLFAGELTWDITAENKSAKLMGVVGASFGGYSIRSAKLEAPAQLITDIYPPAALLNPDGKLQLTTDAFNLSKNNFTGKAQLDWRGAAVSMSPVKPLGDYRATIDAKANVADVQLTTMTGALKLNGKGNWTLKDGLRFSGTAQADAAQAANIDPLLQLMGKSAVNGVYPLEISPK